MRLIFRNELKKALKMKYVITFVFIALIFQGFLQVGYLKHFENIENRISFKESERERVLNYTMFRHYASFGITLLFVPSHFGILYNDSTFELLLSNVNIGDTFDIYLPKKGKELFAINSPFMTSMGIFLLLVFFFGIFYGIDTTIKTDYLKFLSSRSGSKKVLPFTFFFRLILLNAALILMFVINISVLLFNNINLFRLSLLPFIWGIILVTSFSFGIGCILGTIKRNFIRNTAFFVIYILSVIGMVLLLNLITKIKAGDIKPVFEYNHDNLIAVMIEEEMLMKKHGVFPRSRKLTKEEITDARQAIFNQSKKIIENLEGLKQKLKSKIKARKLIASLFPTLFYFSLCEDASTNSYDNFIDFFTFSQNRKQEFVNFCVDKIYPLPKDTQDNQSNQGSQNSQDDQKSRPRIESFIKDDEDLFFAKSKIPRNFWLGSIISILWITVLLFIAYQRTLNQVKGKPGKIRDLDGGMNTEEFNYFLTGDEGLKSQTYNLLSGNGFTYVNITVDGERPEQGNFLYVYESSRFLNDIDKRSLYKELFGKEMPGDLKLWQMLIQYADEFNKFLILDNFFKGIKVSEVKTIIKHIKESGIKALYIGDDYYESLEIGENVIFSKDDQSIDGIKAIFKEKEKEDEIT